MSITRSFLAALAFGAAVSLVAAEPAEAQFGKLKDKVKRKVEERVDRKTDEAAEAAVSSADPTDDPATAAAEPAASESSPGPSTASAGEPGATAAAATLKPGQGAWANYDFKPGERPLFVDDFSRDNVGDFPRRLEFKEGTTEIVEWNGGRFLQATAFGSFLIPLPEVLPERFTVEFDYAGPQGWYTEMYFGGEQDYGQSYVSLSSYSGGVRGADVEAIGRPTEDYDDKVFPVRIMVDGTYIKVYMGEKRVANVPNAKLVRGNKIFVRFGASNDDPVLIGNVRIMAGGKDLYDDLAANGRVATQGIYFDTGSDRLRPESTPTLKEIGTMLKDHPDLRIAIEGHTDNVGQAATNQTLSEKRAAAVRQHLVESYGIEASRLEASGFGATKPVAPNETPEGRQSNRRVELVKL